MPAYDAFLLVSFGGPEGPDDVMPFLQNVTRGRGVPPERLASVAEHYYAVGGVSPINQQCRDLLAAIRAAFPASGLSLPVYWGNRNWTPYLTDTVRDHGRRRRAARRRPRDLRLQLLLELQAVPGGHRAGARRGRPGRAQDRQDQAVLQPPGLHRAVRREHARRAGHAPRRPAGRRPPGVHRAQRPGRDGRGQRARGNEQVRGRADRGRRPCCRTDRRWHAPVDAGLPEPERSALPAVAGTRRARPPG